MNNTDEMMIALIAARLCGEKLTEEEEKKLSEWRAARPENQRSYEYYQDLFRRKQSLVRWEEVSFNREIAEKIFTSRKSKKSLSLFWLKYAAVIVPVLVLSAWFLLRRSGDIPLPVKPRMAQNDVAPGQQKARLELENGEVISLSDSSMAIASHENIQVEDGGVLQYACDAAPAKAVYHTLVVDRASEFQLILPDGTKVWLNSDSELKYPNVFQEATREVYLKGEAYFEVKHSEKQPFIVKAGDCEIRVLGTQFNVSSYEGDDRVLTTLVNGKVAYAAGKKKGELMPGEQCVYDKQQQTTIVKKVDVDQYVSWKNGLFLFDHIRMDELAKQIARWYDVEVLFPDHMVRQVTFTGAMERYKPVSYIIQMLNETNTVECLLKGRTLEFRRK